MRFGIPLALVAMALGLGAIALNPAPASAAIKTLLLYPKSPVPPGPCIKCGPEALNPGNVVINPQSLGGKLTPGMQRMDPQPRPW